MRELLFLLFATKSESCSTKVYVTSPSIWLRCPAPIATAWAGLRQRITWVQQARGRIKFFAARDRLVPTLHRLRFDTVFELFEDEESALSSFH